MDEPSTDSQYLRQMYADIQVLKSHLIGNGNEGLVTTVQKQGQWVQETKGVLKFMRWVLPILSGSTAVLLLQHLIVFH